ncbi:MAG: tetratricopeptide repeat protein [Verrucomicrobiota bacterium]|nr:tetratricopeptide repeat protein [Verrucomicrobiota bacterium]
MTRSILLLLFCCALSLSAAEKADIKLLDQLLKEGFALEGRDSEAADVKYKAALIEIEKIDKADSRYYQGFLQVIGFYLRSQKFQVARDLINRSMQTVTEFRGKRRVYAAVLELATGASWEQEGRGDKAIEAYSKSQQIIQTQFGKYHPLNALLFFRTGRAQLLLKQKDLAERSFKQGLELAESPYFEGFSNRTEWGVNEYSPNYMDVAMAHFELSRLYAIQKETDLALKHYEKGSKVAKNNFGKESPAYSSFESLRAYIHILQGDHAAAMARLDELIRKAETNEKILPVVIDLFVWWGNQAIEREDAELFGKAMAEYLSAHSRNPEWNVSTEDQIMRMVGSASPRMKPVFLEAAFKSVKGKAGSLPAMTFYRIYGQALEGTGKYDQMVEAYSQLLATAEREFGSEHKNVAGAVKLLASAHVKAKQIDRALALCDREIAILIKAFGEKDSRVANAMENKADLLEKNGNEAEAKSLRERAAKGRI